MLDNRLDIKIKLLHPLAKIPGYAKLGDAGADLYSIDSGVIEPGDQAIVHTGVSVEIPQGYVGLVHPRSGLAAKFGITVLNSPGTIDSGYRGEIMINLKNTNLTNPYSYCIHDRIAQLVIQPVLQADFEVVEYLSDSERSFSGHGSSGV